MLFQSLIAILISWFGAVQPQARPAPKRRRLYRPKAKTFERPPPTRRPLSSGAYLQWTGPPIGRLTAEAIGTRAFRRQSEATRIGILHAIVEEATTSVPRMAAAKVSALADALIRLNHDKRVGLYGKAARAVIAARIVPPEANNVLLLRPWVPDLRPTLKGLWRLRGEVQQADNENKKVWMFQT